MAFLEKVNFKKLFWVTTGALSILILIYPIEGENIWVLKFLLVLMTPFLTLSLGFAIGVLELLWEAFAPLLKWLKSWFILPRG